MSSELNFGPQWLRDSFQEGSGGGGPGGGAGGPGGGPGGPGGPVPGGQHPRGGGQHHQQHQQPQQQHDPRGGGQGQSSSAYHAAANKLSALKLAEFRYGREEMLALYEDPDGEAGREPPEGIAKRFAHLWVHRAQAPLSLQGPIGEDEQRAWQRGANSDQSVRTYRKEGSMGGAGIGVGIGGEGMKGAPGVGLRGVRGARGAAGAALTGTAASTRTRRGR